MELQRKRNFVGVGGIWLGSFSFSCELRILFYFAIERIALYHETL
jgi:hypothetical protein